MADREYQPVLSVDFREENRARQKSKAASLAQHFRQCFATESGGVVLEYLRERTSGKLCVGTSHEMAAKAGQRDLFDEIEELIREGLATHAP